MRALAEPPIFVPEDQLEAWAAGLQWEQKSQTECDILKQAALSF